jgi:ribosomal protein L22
MTADAEDPKNEPEPDEGAAEAAPKRRRKPAAKPAAESTEAAKPTRRRRAPKAEADDEGSAADGTDAEGTDAEKPAEAPAKAKPRPAAAKPRRTRGERESGAAPPVVRAQAKYVRTSARKARLVCDHIRGKGVDEARAILAFAPRAAARDWSKLLESAVANAEHNHELVGDDLRVKDVYADEGPTLKRYRPRAMGRATKILKRTTHLTITLTPKE